MRDAADNGRKALEILKQHYQGDGKPRVLSLYTELTSLVKGVSEDITDYILRAEKYASALRTAKHTVEDSLLIAMVLKGLPQQYKPFEVVITQNEKEDMKFHAFKVALRSFEDTEKARVAAPRERDSLNHLKNNTHSNQITCFKCKQDGHKAFSCPNKGKASSRGGRGGGGNNNRKWCTICGSGTYHTRNCRNSKEEEESMSENSKSKHYFAMMNINEFGAHYGGKSFLIDSGSSAHIVNSDENFISYDSEFNPQQHAVTLADGTTQMGMA